MGPVIVLVSCQFLCRDVDEDSVIEDAVHCKKRPAVMQILSCWFSDTIILYEEYEDRLFYILHVAFRR